jgi:hypothetical protein
MDQIFVSARQVGWASFNFLRIFDVRSPLEKVVITCAITGNQTLLQDFE